MKVNEQFRTNHGENDVYEDPWYVLANLKDNAAVLADAMTERMGEPDLWFDGFHCLLWGPRHVHMTWRPSLYANYSYGQHKPLEECAFWIHFWLPWRAYQFTKKKQQPPYEFVDYFDLDRMWHGQKYGIIQEANTLERVVDITKDLEGLKRYSLLAQYGGLPSIEEVQTRLALPMIDHTNRTFRVNPNPVGLTPRDPGAYVVDEVISRLLQEIADFPFHNTEDL